MSDLPYTWTDRDGRSLVADTTGLFITGLTPGTRFTDIPTGEDAAALAKALLEAAGDTGHIVVSTADSERAIRIRESVVAESMRERASDAAETADSAVLAVLAIRALPLLPDNDTEGAHRA